MANYDPQKFINYMFGSASYKLAEEFLPSVTGNMRIKDSVTRWLNEENNIKLLSCIDLIYDFNNEVNKDNTVQLINAVHNKQPITIEEWQNQTKGSCLLIANNKIFVSSPIAIHMVLFFGGEQVKKDLTPILAAYEQYDAQYVQYFNGQLDSMDDLIRLECIHELAEIDRYWYNYFYESNPQEHNNILEKRANYIVQCMRNLN